MTKKQQGTYAAVVAILIVAAAIWFMSRHKANNQTTSPSPEPQAIQQTDSSKKSTSPDLGSWNGTLKTSDNAKKGNLMLTTKTANIYIKTSRDYSKLIGRQVKLSYEGSSDAFVLGDIVLLENIQ